VEPHPSPLTPPPPAHVLRSAVSLAVQLTGFRDAVTGQHLERVSRYARLIARALPPDFGLDDDFVDELAFLAPAHDIGKLAIPDRILLKKGSLDPLEREIMNGHVKSGVAAVESLIRDFGFGYSAEVSMLRNIVRAHHENLDGSGYPDGLRGGEIPLEARIVSVADVFDALTSDRRYKETWTQEEAFTFLREQTDTRFDAACVAALESCASDVSSILRDVG
jgi:HD-GYP domain-containing protein (c-di-GMP phosphodiesterase class II)